MNKDGVEAALSDLASSPGVLSCALVESDSGMVWHACGEVEPHQSLWEAAVDYWRIHLRSASHFDSLGPLGAFASYHVKGVLAIFPCECEHALVVVCVAEHRGVDWIGWQRRVRALSNRLKET